MWSTDTLWKKGMSLPGSLLGSRTVFPEGFSDLTWWLSSQNKALCSFPSNEHMPWSGNKTPFSVTPCFLEEEGHSGKQTNKQVSKRKEEVGLEKEIPFQLNIRRPLTPVTSKLFGYSPYGGYLCVLVSFVVVVVQLLSHVQLFVTPWIAVLTPQSFTISWSLLKFMSIESVMPPNHLILCHPFLLLPSIFPSIRVFSSEWALHIRWPKYWSFSFLALLY